MTANDETRPITIVASRRREIADMRGSETCEREISKQQPGKRSKYTSVD
jgi:hypothetical protein